MSIDYTALVRKHLGERAPSSFEDRKVIYDRLHDAVERTFKDVNNPGQYLAASADLQKAIDEIETSIAPLKKKVKSEQQPPRKWGFWRFIDRLNQLWSTIEKLGKAAALIAAIFVLTGVGYWYFISADRELPSLQRGAVEQTACKPISKEQCDFLIAAIERTKNRGIIVAANGGDLGPLDLEVQRKARETASNPNATAASKERAAADAAIVNVALGRIEENTRRTAEGVGRLENQMREVKRETSSDPHKELANLGYTDLPAAWSAAVRDANIRLLNLVIDAGFRPGSSLASDRPFLSLMRFQSRGLSDENFRVALRRFKQWIEPDLCQGIKIGDMNALVGAIKQIGAAEYRYYCGNRLPAFQTMLDDLSRDWEGYCKGQIGVDAIFTNGVKEDLDCRFSNLDNIIKVKSNSRWRNVHSYIRSRDHIAQARKLLNV